MKREVMHAGERIKILRILSGFTQEKLAELAGVNRSSLVSWERGDYNPSAPAAESLGKVLLCPPGYFLFGTPSPQSAVWEPNPPKVNKYINPFLHDIELLFPSFCIENKITYCAYYSANNGYLLFLGRPNSPLQFLLLLKPLFHGRLSAVLNGLETKEIQGLEGCPRNALHFLDSKTIDSLSLYFRFAQAEDLSIDTDAISTAFLKAKKVRGANTKEDTKSLIRNAFLHFQSVFQEFEVPASWHPIGINPYADCSELLDFQSIIFMRLYEEIEEKSLVWSGEPNKDLDEMVRRFFKVQGFKEKAK